MSRENPHRIGFAAGSFEEHLKKEVEKSSRPGFEIRCVESLETADVVVSNDESTIKTCSQEGKDCLQLRGTRKNEIPVPGVAQTDIERFIPSLCNLLEKKEREK